jgi:hypothetical protein
MEKGTVCLVTRNGLGEAPEDLQRILTVNFFGILADSEHSPETIPFYTDGVKLACEVCNRRKAFGPKKKGDAVDPVPHV